MPPPSSSSERLKTALDHHRAGHLLEAEKIYRHILQQTPQQPDALYLLGSIAFQTGHNDEGCRLLEQAARLRPEPRVFLELADALRKSQRAGDALRSCDMVLSLAPDHPAALSLKGGLLLEQGGFDESLDCLQKAHALQPGNIDILNNLGLAQIATGKAEEAIPAYRRLVAQHPDDFNFHANLTLACLIVGKFDEGFKEYQWRWHLPAFKAAYPGTLWRGENITGKTLLIHGEHGFGDTIQFCRYVDLIQKLKAKIIMRVPAPMTRLMRSLQGIDRVIVSGEPTPAYDFHCSVMDLPAAFKTQPDTVPAQKIYLHAYEADLPKWQRRVPKTGDKIKIGLVWAGSPRNSPHLNAKDRRRSISPDMFAPLTALQGFQFYSLQKEGPKARPELALIDLMSECVDFADTAAFITQLDLVISVDTSVAHLAAALGKPVWMLNRFDTCWRWFYDREDSPWYPTMRIFRQQKSLDWGDVIERVKNELNARAFISG
jgi:Flp pilus assembly protein TadD